MDDLNAIRQRLSGARGPEYWRCLEELADSAEFKALVSREAPRHAAAWSEVMDRRDFLRLMGASLALAGVSGCLSSAPAPPDEKIVPYVRQPEEIIPGRPLYFATAMPLQGYGRGVLAESHMGRPTKVEGNPEHPASLGATDAFTQASVLGLYDPDRSHAINNAGRISTWNAFFAALERRTRSATTEPRRRFANPNRNRDVADFGTANQESPRQISPSQVASISTSRERQRASRLASGIR